MHGPNSKQNPGWEREKSLIPDRDSYTVKYADFSAFISKKLFKINHTLILTTQPFTTLHSYFIFRELKALFAQSAQLGKLKLLVYVCMPSMEFYRTIPITNTGPQLLGMFELLILLLLPLPSHVFSSIIISVERFLVL